METNIMLPKGKESGKKVGKVLIPLLQVALPPNGDYFAVMSVSLLLDFFDLVFGLRCLLPTSEHIIRVSNIGKVGRKTNERMMAMIMCPSKTLNRVSAVCVAQGGREKVNVLSIPGCVYIWFQRGNLYWTVCFRRVMHLRSYNPSLIDRKLQMTTY